MHTLQTRHLALGLVLLALVGGLFALAAYDQGWHRQWLRHMYARMMQGELVAEDVVRLPPGDSPYNRWLTEEENRMPIFSGLALESVHTQPLQPWPEMGDGIRGIYLRFADYQIIDGRLLEIPSGGETSRSRHLYEVGIYLLGGPGHTIIEMEGQPAQRVDWSEGSLISIPLSATYQHYNDSHRPVRLLAVSSFPFVMNAFGDENLLDVQGHSFDRRALVNQEFVHFNEVIDERSQRLNFVQDALTHTTAANRSRGETNRIAHWVMAGNTMLDMHISEFGPRSHKRAHRHSGDAFILLLSGEGFSLAWPEGDIANRMRINWRPGTLFVPPNFWYHQHFNTGPVPARYLVINPPSLVKHLGLRFHNQLDEDLEEVRLDWQEALSAAANPPDPAEAELP